MTDHTTDYFIIALAVAIWIGVGVVAFCELGGGR